LLLAGFFLCRPIRLNLVDNFARVAVPIESGKPIVQRDQHDDIGTVNSYPKDPAAGWLLVGAKSPIAFRLCQAVIPPPSFDPGPLPEMAAGFPFLKRKAGLSAKVSDRALLPIA
jgi:hypothetical protein